MAGHVQEYGHFPPPKPEGRLTPGDRLTHTGTQDHCTILGSQTGAILSSQLFLPDCEFTSCVPSFLNQGARWILPKGESSLATSYRKLYCRLLPLPEQSPPHLA